MQDPNQDTDNKSSMSGGHNSMIEAGWESGTHYDKSSRQSQMIVPPKHLAFFYNVKTIFAYKP